MTSAYFQRNDAKGTQVLKGVKGFLLEIDPAPISTTANGVTTVKAHPGMVLAPVRGILTGDTLASIALAAGIMPAETPANLAISKVEKLKALQVSLATALAAGIAVTASGITATLATDEQSVNQFSGLVTLWGASETDAYNHAYANPGTASPSDAAQAATIAVDATPATIYDTKGAPVVGTIGTLRSLLVAYGSAVLTFKATALWKISQVNAAATIAAVNAIV